MHPSSHPCVDRSLLVKRLDVCVAYDLYEGGTDLRWSQEGVILVSNCSNIVNQCERSACFKAGEAVIMRWDANVLCGEDGSESAQRIFPSKWNPKGKHTKGRWRLDVENKN